MDTPTPNQSADTRHPEAEKPATARLVEIAWFAVLLCVLFAPVLAGMAQEWIHDDDMGHGVFVPLVAGYIAWQKRAELARTPLQHCYWGVPLILWGGAQLLVATLGVEFFLARTAFVISLAGVMLTVWGAGITRKLAFPLFLLLFMIRIPAIIYNQITFPLQLLASSVAETTLSLVGIPVFREGNILELASQKLSVVEACSGIRSLLSLSFLSLVYGYFFERRSWLRVVLFFSTIPIAIAANAFRVTATGVLTEYKRELAEGFFHAVEGWVIFMVALVLLILVHRAISLVFRGAHAR